MTFEEITEADFRAYADKSPYKSFMQTPEIAKYRESNGWMVYYLAAIESGKIKGASMLVARPTFLGKSTFIAPGGPLLDLEDKALTTFFMQNLKKYIKSHNGYLLRISPYYELIQRDRNGEPVEGGFNHKEAAKNLKNLGFKLLENPDQPQYMFAVDIDNRTPDQLMADFKRNTRNHIKKAEKMGVKVRELQKDELGIFKQITKSTSARRHFTDRPLSYYEQMYDLFVPRGEAMFLVAEAKVDAARAEEHQDSAAAPAPASTPLSAAMFMLYGDEVVYLFSGSDEQYMKDYNAQYAIQWHMLKYAAEHGYKRYNFYGIGSLPNPNSPNYGIYDFKKGFGGSNRGEVLEYVGTYELPVNQKFYQLHQFLSKLKNRKNNG